MRCWFRAYYTDVNHHQAYRRGLFSPRDRFVALAYGAASISIFLLAVGVMMISLHRGLHLGYGGLSGWPRIVANTALLLQFPLLHSLLLSRFGRRWLNLLAPTHLARHLQPTTYVLVASIQILVVFILWSPSGNIIWEPRGALRAAHNVFFGLAWILLGKSMWDGHLGVQIGYIGWLSVWRRLSTIPWPDLPMRGIFKVCRQPIYFSFMLTLWTGPTWTTDKIWTASLWTAYCLFGPVFKEQRQLRTYGARFVEYCTRVPYWPGFRSSKVGERHCEDQR